MILFFDVETTGKANFRAPVDDVSQPHIVQLAAILCEPDGKERGLLNVIIKPDGWTVPDETAEIHGITTEIARRCGVTLENALHCFCSLLLRSRLLVAHNIDFDALVVSSALIRSEIRDLISDHDQFCTMKNTTQICKMPGLYKDFKWPKLSEAYRHLFGTEMEGAHDALSDVRACAKVYFAITNTNR